MILKINLKIIIDKYDFKFNLKIKVYEYEFRKQKHYFNVYFDKKSIYVFFCKRITFDIKLNEKRGEKSKILNIASQKLILL